jgi:hypothetical protein
MSSFNNNTHADDGQRILALDNRYKPGIPKADKKVMHKIVHSKDKTGPWSTKPNEYRDLDGKFDPKAEKVLAKYR